MARFHPPCNARWKEYFKYIKSVWQRSPNIFFHAHPCTVIGLIDQLSYLGGPLCGYVQLREAIENGRFIFDFPNPKDRDFPELCVSLREGNRDIDIQSGRAK